MNEREAMVIENLKKIIMLLRERRVAMMPPEQREILDPASTLKPGELRLRTDR